MKHLKLYEDIQVKNYNYIVIQNVSNNLYFLIRNLNISNDNLTFDKYYMFKDNDNKYTESSGRQDFKLDYNNINILYVTDNLDKAINILKKYSNLKNYNL